MLEGIDVSDYQGAIDWETVHDAGKAFVYIKATEGTGHVQKRFAENWAGSLFVGLQRGAYHFMRAGDGRAQAEHFLRHYPGGGELPPALDFEHDPAGRLPTAEQALEWIDLVAIETGVQPIVYCSPSVAESALGAAFVCSDLWIAHWGVKAPRVPRPWLSWRIWQTGKGHVAGIRGDVDLDVMREW